jgi:phage N-6-adenine-methyltransferase
MKRTGPSVKRGKSFQGYQTPPEFIRAVELRFGLIRYDLAATEDNRQALRFISPEQDAFTVEWHKLHSHGLLWLNPPYKNIRRWVKKCADEAVLGAHIALLIPASVSTNYFADYVHGYSLVMPIRPRLVFVGETQPYPKDLMLCLYRGTSGFEPWRWK